MYFVYVFRSKESKRFYIGFTADLKRRVSEHTAGKCHTTKRMNAPKLIFHEAFLSEKDAKRREGYFKTSKGKKALRLILRESLLE